MAVVARFFVPQVTLDTWILRATVDVRQDHMIVAVEGRDFELVEAVRVLREVGGAGDPAQLVGRVKSRVFLEGSGAEIVESSMLLGDSAYDVVPGWLATPAGDFQEHMRSGVRQQARAAHPGADPSSDADLLSRLADETL
jgi:hypothetical protein